MTPLELPVGSKMKLKNDPELRSVLDEELISTFQEERAELRDKAILNLAKLQQENKKTANRRRKKATSYEDGDLVATNSFILYSTYAERTRLKLHPEFFGPYKIISVLRNDRYLVEKIGEHDGPHRTSTSADHMKKWPSKRTPDIDFDSDFGDDNDEISSNEDVA